ADTLIRGMDNALRPGARGQEPGVSEENERISALSLPITPSRPLPHFSGRSSDHHATGTAKLLHQVEWFWHKGNPSSSLIRLALKMRFPPSLDYALRYVSDSERAAADRVSVIEVLGQIENVRAVPILLALVNPVRPAIARAAMTALQVFRDPRIPEA